MIPVEIIERLEKELSKAMNKFPEWPTDPFHALAIFAEESGELTKACLEYTYEPGKGVDMAWIEKEAYHSAATALRWIFSLHRYEFKPCEQHKQD